MNTNSYKTIHVRPEDIERKWYVVDAEGQTLGRLCNRISTVLMGKHRPSYTPNMDCGDFVIVINADKVRLTGNKMRDKQYVTFSGYPGGQRFIAAQDLLAKHPIRLIEHAVKGMLPKSKLGRAMYKKMLTYAGAEHPHTAQKPEPFNF